MVKQKSIGILSYQSALYYKTLLVVFFLLCGVKMATGAYFNIETNMSPFWDTDTMYNESVLMLSSGGGDPQAKLLFTPLDVLSVKSSSLDTAYIEEVDWVYEDGVLKLLAGSGAAYLTDAELYPSRSGDNTFPKKGGGYIMWEGWHLFHQLQLAVTYTHAKGLWAGPVPQYQQTALAGIIAKLKAGKAVRIVFFGDSITAGGNASGLILGISPYMPTWAELVCAQLKRYYPSQVTLINESVGGKKSDWGLASANTLVSVYEPDLVVIAFGMNDGGSLVSASVFKNNIKGIIDKVRSTNPSAEFILVTTTLPNPEIPFSDIFLDYATALKQLAGQGVAIADMTGAHQELLKHKAYRSLTGNNVNHPNDFVIRWYAQQIAGLLIPPDAVELNERRNQASASFGGLASVSSFKKDENYASMVNNDERRGIGWGTNRNGSGWEDNTSGVYPDWVEISFDGPKLIDEVDVYTQQDNWQSPAEPTAEMTFTQNGISDFDIRYWTGTSWDTVPGGRFQDNNRVWVQCSFDPMVTSKIRVEISGAAGGISKVSELEAWGVDAVAGCMDSAYAEYNSNANMHDSSVCQTLQVKKTTLRNNFLRIVNSSKLVVSCTGYHTVTIFDIEGNLKQQYIGTDNSEYNLQNLPEAGVYVVVLNINGQVFNQKLFVGSY
ncbi:MAG: SGNH/GDSL hydrolase family protein [Fibrobacteria bacterium]|nr:SGNH/GDSL hydrolase family protein [Fibrobacteria bacterium]